MHGVLSTNLFFVPAAVSVVVAWIAGIAVVLRSTSVIEHPIFIFSKITIIICTAAQHSTH